LRRVHLQVARPGRHRRRRQRQWRRRRVPRPGLPSPPDRSGPAVRVAALRRDRAAGAGPRHVRPIGAAGMHGFNDWALTLAVFIPLVGAVVMLVIPRALEDWHKGIALVTTVADLVVGGVILARFKLHHTGLQFAAGAHPKDWIA